MKQFVSLVAACAVGASGLSGLLHAPTSAMTISAFAAAAEYAFTVASSAFSSSGQYAAR